MYWDIGYSGRAPPRNRTLWKCGARECGADVRCITECCTTRPFVPCLYGTKVGKEFRPLDLVTCEFRSRRDRRNRTSAIVSRFCWDDKERRADGLGAMCRNPAEFTAFSRFRREMKAELCGRSMSKPYKHLNKYGYRSGSRSCKRISITLLHVNTGRMYE